GDHAAGAYDTGGEGSPSPAGCFHPGTPAHLVQQRDVACPVTRSYPLQAACCCTTIWAPPSGDSGSLPAVALPSKDRRNRRCSTLLTTIPLICSARPCAARVSAFTWSPAPLSCLCTCCGIAPAWSRGRNSSPTCGPTRCRSLTTPCISVWPRCVLLSETVSRHHATFRRGITGATASSG